jgi:hypothetical protein
VRSGLGCVGAALRLALVARRRWWVSCGGGFFFFPAKLGLAFRPGLAVPRPSVEPTKKKKKKKLG